MYFLMKIKKILLFFSLVVMSTTSIAENIISSLNNELSQYDSYICETFINGDSSKLGQYESIINTLNAKAIEQINKSDMIPLAKSSSIKGFSNYLDAKKALFKASLAISIKSGQWRKEPNLTFIGNVANYIDSLKIFYNNRDINENCYTKIRDSIIQNIQAISSNKVGGYWIIGKDNKNGNQLIGFNSNQFRFGTVSNPDTQSTVTTGIVGSSLPPQKSNDNTAHIKDDNVTVTNRSGNPDAKVIKNLSVRIYANEKILTTLDTTEHLEKINWLCKALGTNSGFVEILAKETNAISAKITEKSYCNINTFKTNNVKRTPQIQVAVRQPNGSYNTNGFKQVINENNVIKTINYIIATFKAGDYSEK